MKYLTLSNERRSGGKRNVQGVLRWSFLKPSNLKSIIGWFLSPAVLAEQGAPATDSGMIIMVHYTQILINSGRDEREY